MSQPAKQAQPHSSSFCRDEVGCCKLCVTSFPNTIQTKELEMIQNVVDSDLIEPIWLGDDPTDINFAMKIPDLNNLDEILNNVKALLQSKGIIFKA